MKQGITAQLLNFAHVEPPETARAVMRLSALDWAACGMAGAAEGAFPDWVAAQDRAGACVIFGGGRARSDVAALVNGTLSHALDYDDTHFGHIGHPSVAVLPAALAVGQDEGVGLSGIIDAALVGAEASVAVGLWLGRAHYEVGFHQTATAGAFGATLAAGRLIGLERERMRHALGLCASLASGVKAQFGTMAKPLNAGLAARSGVEAARWAGAGMVAANEGLEGALGFGATHHGENNATGLPVDPWRMIGVSHKFHACCHGLHATLEALRDLSGLRDAGEVEIATHPRWLSVCNQPAPSTGLGAKFSYAHVTAMVAHGLDTADLGNFTDAVAQRADLVAWRSRVRVVGDETLSEMQARVRADGETAFHDLDASMSLNARADRIRRKARALIGNRADDLWRAIEEDDLDAFVRLIDS